MLLLGGKTLTAIALLLQDDPEFLQKTIVNKWVAWGMIRVFLACTSLWWNALLMCIESLYRCGTAGGHLGSP